MKIIFLLLFVPSCGFSQINKLTIKSDIVFKGPISTNQDTALVSYESRESKDSLNFIIIIGKYKSGSRHVEILEDKQTQLIYWKQFYPNGQLKEEGGLTMGERICVGSWKFYLDNGNFDKIINYDTLISIPYMRAIEIAKIWNFKMPNLDIDFVTIDNKSYWQIRKWNMRNGDGKSKTILVSTTDGSIIKPTEEVERHY
jgi:hypothetical protein